MKIQHHFTGIIIEGEVKGKLFQGKVVENPKGVKQYQIGDKYTTNKHLIHDTYTKLKS